MTLHNDKRLDSLVRQAVGVHDEEVASAYADARVTNVLLEEITAMAIDSPVEATHKPAVRTHRRRVTAFAAVATVALVAGVGILWPSQTAPAFAGWTTTPQPVTEEARTFMRQMCEGPSDAVDGRVNPDVVDQRGGTAVARWWQTEDASQVRVTCWIFDTDGDGDFDAGGKSETVGDALQPGPESFTREHAQADGHNVRVWTGMVGPDVDRIVAVRTDGTEVEASLTEDGHFIVWWPAVGDVPELQEIVMHGENAGATRTATWTPSS